MNRYQFKIILIILLLCVTYWPTFSWMKARFAEPESFYAHGFLVPAVVLYLVFRMKERIKRTTIRPDNFGLGVISVSLFIHVFAFYFEINFLSGFAFIATVAGLILFNAGQLLMRQIAFPLFFLTFMVPLPKAMTLALSFKMKLFAAKLASFFVEFFLKIPLHNSGSLIYLPNGVLTVGAPCSGLKSLITLLALCLLFAYLSGFNTKEKVLFFFCTIPIAIIANIIRIILLIVVFYVYGSKVALGWFHDFSGMLVFIIAFIGLVFLRKIFLLWSEK